MQIFYNIDEWTAPKTGTAVVLGRFDGVHVGHKLLLEKTVEIARERGLTSVCFSFSEITYPRATERGILTTDEEKFELIEKNGIDVIINPNFEPPLIETPHDDFFHKIIIDRWSAKAIVVGFDFKFGFNRLGDIDYINRESENLGIDVTVFEPVEISHHLVKGKLIRAMIGDGEIERASVFLGRPYFVRTSVESGRGIGNQIGFPTINLPWPQGKVQPMFGVYAVACSFSKKEDGKKISYHGKVGGVANFGVRPTVDEDRTIPILEVHLFDPGPALDFIGDPPAKNVEVTTEFIGFIRNEKKFESIKSLSSQIKLDAQRARGMVNFL